MRNLLAILAFSAMFPLLGCSSPGPLDKLSLPGPGPTGLDEQQFSDIPTASGFRLIGKRSFSYQVADLRLGRFVYEDRRLSPRAALRYYRAEMIRSLYGWTIDDVDSDGGFATFRKGRDEARVHCEKIREENRELTRITVDVNYPWDATRTQP